MDWRGFHVPIPHDERMVQFGAGAVRRRLLPHPPFPFGSHGNGHLLLDKVSGDPIVESSRMVSIPSPRGREVGHRRAPAVYGVSQTRLPVSRAYGQVTGIRTRRPVELPVRPARHLRPERSAA
jgi:hypothetical protein